MEGLFTDPNCTQSLPWATWLSGLDELTLGAAAAEPGLPEAGRVEVPLLGLACAWPRGSPEAQNAQRAEAGGTFCRVSCVLVLPNPRAQCRRQQQLLVFLRIPAASSALLLCFWHRCTSFALGVCSSCLYHFCSCPVEARQPHVPEKRVDTRKASIGSCVKDDASWTPYFYCIVQV